MSGFLLSIFGMSKNEGTISNSQKMRKCAILFLILIVALVFAAVSEKNNTELGSDWNKVVARK